MSECPRCSAEWRAKRQIYLIQGELGRCVFDVEMAREIASDGRHNAAPVPREILLRMLGVNEEYEPQHLDHVDPSIPGIALQRLGGVALADGNHRARRCLRDGLEFRAYLLDIEESQRCVRYVEQTSMSHEVMARELRGVLRNNPHAETITATVGLDAGEERGQAEAALRSILSAEENGRIILTFK